MKNHLKFLKNPTVQMEIGGYMPHSLKIDENQFEDISYLYERNTGSVIIFISAYCSVCNLDAVQQIINLYPRFQYILFTDEVFEKVKQFQNSNDQIKIVKVDVAKAIKKIGIPGVPFAIGINSEGQIVSGEPFDSIDSLKLAIRPLLKVFYNELF